MATRVALFENDVATLMHVHNPPVETLLNELTAYLNDTDLIQTKQIIEEIQLRIRRFEDRA